MTLADLVKRADVVAIGRCESCVPSWNHAKKRIYTTITIKVSEYLKGSLGPKFYIRQIGGRIGTKEMRVPGMPLFRPGAEFVIFLAKADDGSYHVVGLSQGLFEVFTDTIIGQKVVRKRRFDGLKMLGAADGSVKKETNVWPMTLETFKSKVKEQLRGDN